MAIKKSTNILGNTGGGGSSGDVKSVNHIQPGPDGDITVPMFGLGLGPVARTDAYSNIAQFYRINATSKNKPPAVIGNVSAGVLCLPMDAAPSAGYFAVVGGSVAAYVGYSGVEAGGITWSRIYTDKFKPTLAELKALGNTGDQVLDGKLQLNHQLVLKSIVQTDANVLAFKFGEDDDVIDVAIKATATPDNHGQLALGVRDDTGNVINALSIDGHSKAIMVQPGYKLYVGNSSVDLSTVTPFGLQLMACQDVAAARTLLGITG
jgi:hypothetical protein